MMVVFCQLDILDEGNSIEEFPSLEWPIDMYVEFVLNGRAPIHCGWDKPKQRILGCVRKKAKQGMGRKKVSTIPFSVPDLLQW